FRAIIPQKEVEAVLLEGRKHTLMPAFAFENGGSLTKTRIQFLVHEIKGIPDKLVEKTADDPASREVVPEPQGQAPVWGVFPKAPAGVPAYKYVEEKDADSAAALQRGMVAFDRACQICHGKFGLGTGHNIVNNNPTFLGSSDN